MSEIGLERKQQRKPKMVQCVLCPEYKCTKDCPTLEVLPYEGPLKEENIRKARKLIASGKKVDDIQGILKVAGNVAAKNELINKWIEEYESKEKDRLYHLSRKRTLLIQQKNILEEKRKILAEKRKILADRMKMLESAEAVLKEASAEYETLDSAPAPLVADIGLPGLKKRTTVLDGTSLKD